MSDIFKFDELLSQPEYKGRQIKLRFNKNWWSGSDYYDFVVEYLNKSADFLPYLLSCGSDKRSRNQNSDIQFQFIEVEYHMDNRIYRLFNTYDTEQQDLEKQIQYFENEIESYHQKKVDTDKFLKMIEKYTDIEELTVPMINEYIEKVVVHEATGGRQGKNRKQYLAINISRWGCCFLHLLLTTRAFGLSFCYILLTIGVQLCYFPKKMIK